MRIVTCGFLLALVAVLLAVPLHLVLGVAITVAAALVEMQPRAVK